MKNKDFKQYSVVAFDPIKIFTHKAPQNDCLNLSFVKDEDMVGEKTAIYQLLLFRKLAKSPRGLRLHFIP